MEKLTRMQAQQPCGKWTGLSEGEKASNCLGVMQAELKSEARNLQWNQPIQMCNFILKETKIFRPKIDFSDIFQDGYSEGLEIIAEKLSICICREKWALVQPGFLRGPSLVLIQGRLTAV